MTRPDPDARYSLEQLAGLAGTNRRTIRYYIQLGLVDPPIGQTRGAYYTWQHLKRLLEIRELTEQGFSLERVQLLLDEPRAPEPAAATQRPGSISVRSHLHLAAGVELVIDPGVAGLTPEQLRRFAREAMAAYAQVTRTTAESR